MYCRLTRKLGRWEVEPKSCWATTTARESAKSRILGAKLWPVGLRIAGSPGVRLQWTRYLRQRTQYFPEK